MKKKIVLISIFLLPILFSCNYFRDPQMKFKIDNLSNVVFDSVKIFVYPNYDTVIYNVKPNFILTKKFNFKDFEYKRIETCSGSVSAFKDSIFYSQCLSIIDYPYAIIEDMECYIFDNGISSKKDWKPKGKPLQYDTFVFRETKSLIEKNNKKVPR